jgi:hypothetical protein
LTRLDVLAPARVDRELGVGKRPLHQGGFRFEQHLPDGRVRAEGVLVAGPIDRGGFEQLPAIKDRLRVDRGSSAARGADREVEVGRLGVGLADPADHGPADHLGADLERAKLHRLGVELEGVVAFDELSGELRPLSQEA